jgi:hypothetical protein
MAVDQSHRWRLTSLNRGQARSYRDNALFQPHAKDPGNDHFTIGKLVVDLISDSATVEFTS